MKENKKSPEKVCEIVKPKSRGTAPEKLSGSTLSATKATSHFRTVKDYSRTKWRRANKPFYSQSCNKPAVSRNLPLPQYNPPLWLQPFFPPPANRIQTLNRPLSMGNGPLASLFNRPRLPSLNISSLPTVPRPLPPFLNGNIPQQQLNGLQSFLAGTLPPLGTRAQQPANLPQPLPPLTVQTALPLFSDDLSVHSLIKSNKRQEEDRQQNQTSWNNTVNLNIAEKMAAKSSHCNQQIQQGSQIPNCVDNSIPENVGSTQSNIVENTSNEIHSLMKDNEAMLESRMKHQDVWKDNLLQISNCPAGNFQTSGNLESSLNSQSLGKNSSQMLPISIDVEKEMGKNKPNSEQMIVRSFPAISPTRAHQLDLKDLLREPYLNEKDIKKAWWNLCILRSLHCQYHRLNAEDMKAYQSAIEDFLLNLKEHVSPENAKVAADVIELKRELFNLRCEDLLFFAQIQAEVQNFDGAFASLQELRSKYGLQGIHRDADKLFYFFIEEKGLILQYWDDFKEKVVHSQRVMDQLFSVVPHEVLRGRITKIDLAHCYKQMRSGNMSLSFKSKTAFLKLYSESAGLTQLVELLREWPDLNCVPLITVEKILNSIQCFSDILGPLNVLRRLPQDVASAASDSWNAILLNCFEQGDQYIQAGEQIYSLMKKYEILPTLQVSLRMLGALCSSNQYNLFISRFEHILSLDVFPKDYIIPDWFAEKISDLMDTFHDRDLNVLHQLVTFSLCSTIQPREEKVVNVIDMLIARRRYGDLHAFVKNCFKAKLLLSQLKLRQVITELEKWTANPDASVEVYKLMRSVYPRAEQSCYCVACTNNRSNSKSFPGKCQNLKESGSKSVNLEDEEIIFSPDTSVGQNQRSLLRIAAELNESSGNRRQFKDLYIEAVHGGGANDDTILCGLFLGLSSKEFPGKEFNIFVTLIGGEDSYFLDEVSLALGRLGVRLIKHLHTRSLFSEAYEVLMVFHNHGLAYARCGQPFSSLIETADQLSLCEIAMLCCDTCLKNRQYDGALEVLRHCTYGFDEGNPKLSSKEITLRNTVAGTLIEKFILAEKTEEASEVFFNVNDTLDLSKTMNFFERLIASASSNDHTEIVEKIESFVKENSAPANKRLYTSFITAMTKCKNHGKAEEMFTRGMSLGIYEKTYDVLNPLLLHAPTDLNKIELTMVIEFHLKKLRVDPYYELFCRTVQSSQSSLNGNHCNLRILIVPHKSEKGADFAASVQRTMDMLVEVVSHNIVPGLEVTSREDQYLEVSGRSMLFWFKCRDDLNTFSPSGSSDSSRRRSVLMEIRKKRKIDICNENGKENMQMTYVPTPKYVPTPRHDADIDTSSDSCSILGKKEEILKDFPDSDNEREARFYISRIICAKLTLCMKKGLLKEEEFMETGRTLFQLFLNSRSGSTIYNEQVGLLAQKFVEEKMLRKEEMGTFTSEFLPTS